MRRTMQGAARLALIEDAKARGFEDALRPICLQK